MDAQSVDALLSQCLSLFNARKYAEATDGLKQVVAAQPGNVKACTLLGACLGQTGHHSEAVEQFLELTRLDHGNPLHYFNLGNAYRSCGKIAQAEGAYRKAIEINPGYQKATDALSSLSVQGDLSNQPVGRQTTSQEPTSHDVPVPGGRKTPDRRTWLGLGIPMACAVGCLVLMVALVLIWSVVTAPHEGSSTRTASTPAPVRSAPAAPQRYGDPTQYARQTSSQPSQSRLGVGPTLPEEPAPRPALRRQGSAHIGNARLSVTNDGRGNETCIGRVMVVNDGPYELTDFRLGLEVNGIAYVLVPFQGSADYPMPIYSRHINPGGSLDCPVQTTGSYSSYSIYGMKRVLLHAVINGPPYEVFDECTVM